MPRDRRAARLTGALIAAAALLAGCTLGPSNRPDLAVYGGDAGQPAAPSAETSAPPTGPGGPGQTAALLQGWGQCAGLDVAAGHAADFEISCGAIAVPIDYAMPANGQLTMVVGRARAQGLPEDAPPLVVIMGNGPWESSTAGVHNLAATAAALPAAITAKFQIIGVDIRGSGGSVDVDCLQDGLAQDLLSIPAEDSPASWDSRLTDITRNLTFNCQDTIGPVAVFFGSTQVADDLDSVRSALGQDSLNLVGVGYGATLGALYASRYPGRVGRLVLDSPTDQATATADRAVAAATPYERTLQAFAASCALDPQCALGPDAVGAIRATIAGLGPNSRQSDIGWNINNGTVVWALILALPDQSRWPGLAAAIAAAKNGDINTLGHFLESLLSKPNAALSLRLVLNCNDSDQRQTAGQLADQFTQATAASPVLGAYLVGLSSVCSAWPAAGSPLGALRAQGAAPMVVIGGVNDAVAPYVGVQSVVNQLASATLITYLSTDHGAYPRNPCIADQVNPYLLDGTRPTAGVLCPA